jgi:tRNA-dihydrouridine synthase 3
MHICRCKGSHDLLAYLQIKPADLHIPTSLDTSQPFVSYGYRSLEDAYGSFAQCLGASSLTRCPYFDEFGECKVGFKCRFLGAHLQSTENPEGGLDVGLMKEAETIQFAKKSFAELNGVDSGLMKSLRKREVSSN